jgi:hypothetical protein
MNAYDVNLINIVMLLNRIGHNDIHVFIHSTAMLNIFDLIITQTYGWLHNYAGHFLPEEDDKFLERVQAAVEEEERQAIAAADTDAARDAIATAEESRKPLQSHGPDSKVLSSDKGSNKESIDQLIETENNEGPTTVTDSEGGKQGSEGQGFNGAYESLANLPLEFYHYYHGSNADMGTLIEVISISTSSSFYISCKIQLSTVFNVIDYLIVISNFV